MIDNRQEQLEKLYVETFGENVEVAEISKPVTDLILDPEAYPPLAKFKRLLQNSEFFRICENRGDYASLSEHDFALAKFAVEDDWSDQEIADLIIAFRRKHGQSSKDREKALRSDYIQRTLDRAKDGGRNTKRLTVASQLVELADDIELFHTPDKKPYAVIKSGGHSETWSLASRAIKDYLARRYYEKSGSAPNSQAIQDALNVLRGRALFDGGEEPVYTRIAGFDGKTYLDLCNLNWSVVEITAKGWQIIQTPPIHFIRSGGMMSLPMPQKGGDVNALRDLLNVTSDDWPLLMAWILGTFMPNGPYPVLVLTGEQGSAKSTVARIVRSLVDPSTILLRSLPRGERDLAISAANSWVQAFDNVSYLPFWLSDAICRLATGGGFATRELYTDSGEMLFTATRPVMLNGIGEIATQSDLLDRTIIITLPPIPNDKRLTEAVLWEEFELAHPKVLASFLEAVSLALRDVNTVSLDDMPRMADFVKWIVAAIPALDVTSSDFLTAYYLNIEGINQLALESSPAVNGIMILAGELPEGGEWVGTATQLLEILGDAAGDTAQRRRDWPKSARALGAILSRLAPNLRAIGVDITRDRGSGERLIHIRKGEQKYVTPAKRRKKCIVTKLDSGGFRIQMRL